MECAIARTPRSRPFHCTAALNVWKKEQDPEYSAQTKCNLGGGHGDCVGDEHEVSVKEAIACYEAALLVFTPGTHPEKWV